MMHNAVAIVRSIFQPFIYSSVDPVLLFDLANDPDERRNIANDPAQQDRVAEFEKLVRSTISTRGITIQSIIKRLVDTNSVGQDKQKRQLKLLVDHYSPYLSEDEPNMINAAFSAISNLLSTIEFNVESDATDRMFQRQAWTFRLSPEDREAFRLAMREMLEQYEENAFQAIGPWEMELYGEELVRITAQYSQDAMADAPSG